MDAADTSRILAALGHEGRLLIFRLLVQAGSEGLPAGEVARRAAQLQNTTSSNLSVLANVGLVASRREGRSIIYAVNATPFRDALTFITARFFDSPDVRREPSAQRLLAAARRPRAGRPARPDRSHDAA
jgi:ArsR family transcriptional regulator, arsenate/arsenite/antimonite-responsive transcriptional repressor